MSWELAWQEQRTGWDQGAPVPSLVDDLKHRPGDGTKRALVPGCGAGYDVFALANAGYRSTGLDLAPTAAKRFEMLRLEQGFTQDQAQCLIQDFFAYNPLAPFDLVWDYTFLCAIPPSRRLDWGIKMAELVRPGGVLLTLLFPVREPDNPAPVTDEDQGPPYRLHLEHARQTLGRQFELIECKKPERSHPGRNELELFASWMRMQG